MIGTTLALFGLAVAATGDPDAIRQRMADVQTIVSSSTATNAKTLWRFGCGRAMAK